MELQKRDLKIRWLKVIDRGRLITVLILLFPLIWLGKKILQGQTLPIDIACLQWINSLHTPVFKYTLPAFYWLGNAGTSAVFVIIGLGVLGWKRYWNEAVILAFSTLGILLIIDKGLKPFFARYRPPNNIPSAIGYSFPSGHASGNTMLYFYIASILAVRFPKMATYFYGLATILLILMGFGSVYTRAHWLTDILAGYGVGYIWFTIVMALLNLSNFKTRRYY